MKKKYALGTHYPPPSAPAISSCFLMVHALGRGIRV
jgi:hypothetical protein